MIVRISICVVIKQLFDEIKMFDFNFFLAIDSVCNVGKIS